MEFGAKISVSLTGEGLAHVDKLHWDAQHEGHDLEAQVEAYKKRYGYYPEVVIADTLYGSRDNRGYLRAYPLLRQTTGTSAKEYLKTKMRSNA